MLVKDRGPRIDTTRFPNSIHAIPAMPKIVGYKIRRIEDGRYSTGGSTPEFTTVGKTWSNKQTLHSHFAVIQEYGEYAMRRHKNDAIPNFVAETYAGCEIVRLAEVSHMTISDYLLIKAVFDTPLEKL